LEEKVEKIENSNNHDYIVKNSILDRMAILTLCKFMCASEEYCR